MKTLRLLSREDGLAPGGGPAELLFECASDSPLRAGRGAAHGLDALLGEPAETKEAAFRLASKLLSGEPAARGVRQLGVLEELVIRELQHALHAVRLHAFAVDNGFELVSFESRSRWAETLESVARFHGGALRVESTAPSRGSGPVRRGWARLRDGGFSTGAFRGEAHLALERLDPFHRRSAVASRLRHSHPEPGRLWFYTTAHTYTRIGLDYEPFFPEPFNFLVENPLTGGAPLRAAGRRGFDLYGFGAADLVPSRREVRVAATAVREHVSAARLPEDEAAARSVFMNSAWFGQFENRLLAQGLHQTSLFERWLAVARPSGLVVGNPCFEGYALQAARRGGVPTILLQHGVLGDYCQLVEPPADHYVVRGEFWRDFLSRSARAKAAVLNPPERAREPAENRRGSGHILFVTAPYASQELWHPAELTDILKTLLKAAARLRVPLLVRVHPRERVEFYRALVGRVSRAAGIAPDVRFSQGGEEGAAVAGSAAAVLFCSTMFLECLRRGVPVVSFAWHDFSFKDMLARRGAFHFAEDLAHLDRLVSAAVAGDLPPGSAPIGEFLSPSDLESLAASLGALLVRPGAP